LFERQVDPTKTGGLQKAHEPLHLDAEPSSAQRAPLFALLPRVHFSPDQAGSPPKVDNSTRRESFGLTLLKSVEVKRPRRIAGHFSPIKRRADLDPDPEPDSGDSAPILPDT
jgi:hypothetical protein